MGMKEVRAGALALSDDERAQLADELLRSLHPEGTEPEALDQALAERLAKVRAGSAVVHDISVATERLARMLEERRG